MAKFIGALFFDKFRGILTLLVLLIIAVILGLGYLYPKPVKLDEKTTESIISSVEVMRKAAGTMEQMAQDNYQFRQSLVHDLALQADMRKQNYATLYEEYGIGNLPSTTGSAPSGIGYGLQQPPNLERSGHLPPGKGQPDADEQLQHPASDRGAATGRSDTRVPGGNSSTAPLSSGGTGNVPRTE